jgi:hypothetical protein
MAIGNTGQTDPASLNAQAGGIASRMEALMDEAINFASWYNKLSAADQASLFGLDAADSQAMANCIGYMNTVGQVYFGSATQGTAFDFSDALTELRGPVPI